MSERSREAVLANLELVRRNVARACERADRDPTDVRIVAAGKNVEHEAIAWVRET